MLVVHLLLVLGLLAQCQFSADAEEEPPPSFGEPVKNVTAARGRDATLVCVTENLDNYKVAWVKVDTQTILTIGSHLITRNYQISLTQSDARVWNLRIGNVQRADAGWYMCQINTDPMISQMGYLEVVEPPDIVLESSSEDMLVHEGETTRLRCVARGYPSPSISWYREDTSGFLTSNTEVTINGTDMSFTPVRRHHMGVYLCVASNGIPPSVSKRIVLQVQFPPQVNVSSQMLAAVQGSTVTVQCRTAAFPRSITYWVRANSGVVVSGSKFKQQEIVDGYKLTMQLEIFRLTGADFTSYKCVAKNPHGEAEETIRITERQPTPEEREEQLRQQEAERQQVRQQQAAREAARRREQHRRQQERHRQHGQQRRPQEQQQPPPRQEQDGRQQQTGAPESVTSSPGWKGGSNPSSGASQRLTLADTLIPLLLSCLTLAATSRRRCCRMFVDGA